MIQCVYIYMHTFISSA